MEKEKKIEIRLGQEADHAEVSALRALNYWGTGSFAGSVLWLEPENDPPNARLIVARDEESNLVATAIVALFEGGFGEMCEATHILGGLGGYEPPPGPVLYFGRAAAREGGGAYKAIRQALHRWAATFAVYGEVFPALQCGINMADGRAISGVRRLGYQVLGPLNMGVVTFAGEAYLGVLTRTGEVDGATVNQFQRAAEQNAAPPWEWHGPKPFHEMAARRPR
ncbi:MAG: hypothetical protein HUU30_04275 [Burkholderiaceae bacterium]|nr:hypothetical protein [Aquabacterium sp.]NUP84956.1 hypothetical protein [Burkholderiaceae bacterium]